MDFNINGVMRCLDDWNTFLLHRTKIDPISNCHIWTGAQNGVGYGRIRIGGRYYTTHRISAFLYLGLDLDNYELQANHKRECNNPICWYHEHLYVGTQAQNMADSAALGTHRGGPRLLAYCTHGHEMTEANTGYRKGKEKYCRACARISNRAAQYNMKLRRRLGMGK